MKLINNFINDFQIHFSEDSCIVLPLSISDPCSGTLHFCLEVKKSSDDVDPVTNVVNAAAASGNSPVSPDAKLQYLTKATLFPSGGVRRKVDSAEHNKIMSLARYDAYFFKAKNSELLQFFL